MHFSCHPVALRRLPGSYLPTAASPGSPAPPARKSHHLLDTGSYLPLNSWTEADGG
jgi:hypothetical protein